MLTADSAGTAGLRAKMGPGFSRMNPVTIQQTTQGLLRYLQQQAPQQLADNGVIIGEDRQQVHRQQPAVQLAVVFQTPFLSKIMRKDCVSLGA